MTTDGFGGVSGRSGPSLAPVSLDPLQPTRRGIENNIGRTVDNSSLKAGVAKAKRYYGCHRSRVVCDELSVSMSFAILQPQRLRDPNQIERRLRLSQIGLNGGGLYHKGVVVRITSPSKALAPGLGLRFLPAFCHQQTQND
jgi:hypothetical protein